MKKILAISVLAVGMFIAWKTFIQLPPVSPVSSPSLAPSPTPVGRLIINYQGVDTKTALELLKSSHETVTKSSSYGEYVDSIDGIAGGVENRYWILYVDGKMATIGADALVTKSNQLIEWKFETQEENGTI